MFVRFLIEGCLDVSICIYCQWVFTAESEEGLTWSSRFEIVNNISMFVLATALFIFPIFIAVFYCVKFAKWGDEDFENKYGSILEGLRKDSRASLAYPLIFISRRFLLVVVTTVTQEKLFVQLIYMNMLSFLQVFYLATFRPFEEPLILKVEIFNEVTTVLLVDLLPIFSEGNPFEPVSFMDMFFLICLSSNICVHLFFLI